MSLTLIKNMDTMRQSVEVTLVETNHICARVAYWADGKPYLVLSGTDMWGNRIVLQMSAETCIRLGAEIGKLTGSEPCNPPDTESPPAAPSP